MAQQIVFNQAILRCGFNQATTDIIIAEGLEDLDSLNELEYDDIDRMIKNVREARRGLPTEGVSFPTLPGKRLKALHSWVKERVRTGVALNAGHWTDVKRNAAVACFSVEQLRSETQEDTPDKPGELTDLAKWEIFWERFKSYLRRIRGAAKCPLTYVIREQQAVTAAERNAVYEDHDMKLVATTLLEGDWFFLDNQHVYDEFKALVLKGPRWGFIKTYDRRKDGRNAVLALRRQAEGTSATQTRKTSAYATISNARYSGQKKTFPFARYVEIHQTAHNTLEELGEPVPETKKVTDFLAGISDPRLSNAKDTVLGDAAKLQNFEECQQYFQMLVFNKSTQVKYERNITGLTGENPKGNPKGNSDKDKGKKRGITARSYSDAEWKQLTEAQRTEVRALRTKQKNKKRNTSSLTQEVQPDPNPGAQQQQDAAQGQQPQPAGAAVIAQVQQAATQFVPAVAPARRG